MNIDLKLEGMDALLGGLDSKPIKDKAFTVLQKHAARVHSGAMRRVPVDTGFLKRSINAPRFSTEAGVMTAKITAGAEYAPYIELGTRFMRAQPFMDPSLREVIAGFIDEIGGLIK